MPRGLRVQRWGLPQLRLSHTLAVRILPFLGLLHRVKDAMRWELLVELTGE